MSGDPALLDMPAELAGWFGDALGDPGPFTLYRLGGGNSNETLRLSSPRQAWIVRRPPDAALSPTAHNFERERRILAALAPTDVPAPLPLALCEDPAVSPSPLLVLEAMPGTAITTTVPPGYRLRPNHLMALGNSIVDALATLHQVPWREVGLEGFGNPEGFLGRQVGRWQEQLERYRLRDLPWHAELAEWLTATRPAEPEPTIMHGDFHLDNCLVSTVPPIRVMAMIDWELATIGDPLVDLGLFLAFWGTERPPTPAMAWVQAASRGAGSPSRRQLAERYAQRSGRSVERLDWYMAFAFWKLATIVEGAYAQYRAGRLDSAYARGLETEVPNLLTEAAGFAGLAPA
jgi:aminoglycoside phosphotransferase (APT) family kinase protein